MAANKIVNQAWLEFKQQAEALSASVYRVENTAGAGEQLARIIQKTGARKIVAANSGLVKKCLDHAGSKEVYTTELHRHAASADLGLSEVDMAIAETGSLVLDSSSLDQRLVSTLPPVHVALVPSANLVASFGDAMAQLNGQRDKMPGYISFISGPSRTADIERVLTIGVHGPGQLHIILVDKAGEPGE